MARKKKSKISPSVLKIGGVLILSLIIGVGVYFQMAQFLKKSDYFVIKVVKKDDTLQFINGRELSQLMGRNIFTVDLDVIQNKLSRKYPQASELRVVRRFPNQIEIVAQKRLPFLQTSSKGKTLTLDEVGVLLSTTTKVNKNLPWIVGAQYGSSRMVLGLPLTGKYMKAALKILNSFKERNFSISYKIVKVNVENLSKIYLEMSNGLQVIVDKDGIDRKIKILNIVLSEGRIDIEEVKYIDLRFKEPILGKK
jgi:cell division septal protein FtsQ